MRDTLWPGDHDDHASEIEAYFVDPPTRAACFVAASAGGLVGFAEVGLRDYAEECRTSPVGYLEGIWVDPEHRRGRVGAALVEAGEAWARALGCTEMASDRALDNEASGAFHLGVGYEEAIRIVCYRKLLTGSER